MQNRSTCIAYETRLNGNNMSSSKLWLFLCEGSKDPKFCFNRNSSEALCVMSKTVSKEYHQIEVLL